MCIWHPIQIRRGWNANGEKVLTTRDCRPIVTDDADRDSCTGARLGWIIRPATLNVFSPLVVFAMINGCTGVEKTVGAQGTNQ